MTDHTITFEPLPTPANGRPTNPKTTATATQLRNRPGEWAHIKTMSTANSARSTAHAIRTGRRPAHRPAGAFEATARTVNGEYRVYARYIGTPTPAA